jgi:hypothetical protein
MPKTQEVPHQDYTNSQKVLGKVLAIIGKIDLIPGYKMKPWLN